MTNQSNELIELSKNLPRSEQEVEINTKKDIEFSIIDWFECDMINDNRERGYWLNKGHDKTYKLFAFGVTSEGHSVCLRINNYHPYFFLQIPENFNQQQEKDFCEAFLEEEFEDVDMEDYQEEDNENIKNEYKFNSLYYKSAINREDCKITKNQIFWSFMNGKLFKFFKVSTVSKNSYKFLQRYFQKAVDLNISKLNNTPIKYKQFESDLDISLRFFHDSKIKPSHWIKLEGDTYKKIDYQSKCQIDIECDWRNIIPIEKTEIPPLIVAAFDIEADSSHGDFPQPLKDCKKLANNLVVAWIRDQRILQKEDSKSNKYLETKTELDLKEEYFNRRIKQALNVQKYHNYDSDISLIYLKDEHHCLKRLSSKDFQEMCKQLYEICNHPIRKVKANTEMKQAVTLVFEMQDEEIKSTGFITLTKFKDLIKQVSRKTKISLTDLQDKIITKDIMSRFVNQELNKFFGRAHGDPVIQIGTVFWKFGDDKPFHNNIITLKGCSSFNVGDEPCEIISKNNEINVLLEWARLIERYDPDIITGYNIFGFDETFMYDRIIDLIGNFRSKNISKDQIKHLGTDSKYQECMNLTRFTDDFLKKVSEARGSLINKKLSSSALGDNFLYYFNMPGRVQIDLLKVCQASMTKLPSYKLDSVAEFYISGKIKSFLPDEEFPNQDKTHHVQVENIKELDLENFVVISMMTTGQKLYDGEKLKIINLDRDNNSITLSKPIPTDCIATIPVWGLAKDDVSPKDIFRLQKGSNSDRGIIAKYCIQDCALLIRLIRKLDTISNNFGMSNVCLVPFSYIFMRGQGIKIFSLMVNECSLNNYKLPVLEKIYPEEEELEITDRLKNPNINPTSGEMLDDDEEQGNKEDNSVFQLKSDFNVIKMTEDSYEGAIVLTPKPDIYTEPITVLDFSSLYPSEMIASDLSHDRICEDPYWLGDEGVKHIKDLGLDYLDRTYDNYTWVDPKNKNKGKKKDGEKTVRFIQYPDGSKGLIPKVEQKLLGARKATKKLMKTEKDAFKYSILDGLQLAYKLVANSLYGQIGAKTSKIFKKEIAASITAGGRMRIYQARDFCLENNKGCEVVYGDSVPKDEPIVIRYTYPSSNTKKIKLISIQDLVSKNIYGYIKQPVLDRTYLDNEELDNESLESISLEDEIENSSKLDNNKSNKEYYTSIKEVEVWSKNGFTPIKKVIRHKTLKQMYRIITTSGIVEVTEDHSLVDEFGKEIKPTECKIGTKLMSKSFLKLRKNESEIEHNIDVKYLNKLKRLVDNKWVCDVVYKIPTTFSKLKIANIYQYIVTKTNYNVETYLRNGYYHLYITNREIANGIILSIDKINYSEDYVYDLETYDHHFHAGIGNLIVHNTDSVFVKFNLERPDGSYPTTDYDKVKESIDIGLKIQQQLKDEKIFPAPHDLEYEKVFYPLILITKKRYIGIKYEFEPDKGKKTSMGVVTKRRDNAPILKHTFIGVVDTLMKERNIPKAIKFVQDVCYQMVDDAFDLNMFVISKTLREYYKDPGSIAHKVLADRMAERDPGNKPASNERLPYVYIKIDEQPGVDYLQGDRIEHINYVRENHCKVDYATYITNQIIKPVSQIFELVVERLPSYPYPNAYFENLENQYYNKYKGDLKKTIKKISELKQKLIRKLIFEEVINYAINKANNVKTLDDWIINKKVEEINKNDSLSKLKSKDNKIKPNSKNKEKKTDIKKMKQLDLNSWLS
jgi:DNA polymerase elongation subunit (family B)